ncbi:hypothetical protein LAZ67_23000193 [Cordylochernes scorpioides]|uniref:Reverse transcriptase domain-containing protein n=1 Tax=Cordylochernes scorpioides TaxID=51811 RepID=A0ABY6LPR6_9ARAC|nr:hypothetical protein LAZ67_23000193 [Cordylochernes scorpioides]
MLQWSPILSKVQPHQRVQITKRGSGTFIIPSFKILSTSLQVYLNFSQTHNQAAKLPVLHFQHHHLQPQPNKIMISFDVESLYPSLPHQLILSSTEEFLRENKVDQIIVRKITKLIALCLETNILTYDSKTYEQIKGSPMGSSLSTSVAEIVMRRIDNWITSLFPSDIVLWRRYIDDIFCICPENQTRNILERLNSYHPNLNFTFEKETNNSLPFLDIKIIRIQNQFQTTVYYKPSYCPLSHKINTVKTLTKRIHSHCSLQTFKTEETQNIIRNLKTCQYPLSFILRHFYSPSEIQNSPIYKSISSIPYSPVSVSIARHLKKFGIKTFFRNSPNLNSLLRNPITKNNTIYYPSNFKNAIYSIECNECKTKYVGETGRHLNIRVSEHKRNIDNQDSRSLVYQHIRETGHSFSLSEPKTHYSTIPNRLQRLIIESIISRKHNSINRRIDIPEIYNIIFPEPSP